MTLSCANGFGFLPGWISQALQAVRENPSIFLKANMDQAMDHFGLGNKKVEALQFWMRAAGLAELTPEGVMSLTPVGTIIREHDPYCTLEGTWWFIHTHLSRVKPEPGLRDSTTWRWYTYNFNDVQFTKEDLRASLGRAYPHASARTVASAINELGNSIQGCSLGEMGLMRPSGDGFVRQSPAARQLHPAVLAYAIQIWAADRNRSGETVHLSELTSGDEPVRRLFNLSESRFPEDLANLANYFGAGVFSFNITAGLNSFVLFERNPLTLVKAYYLEVVGGLTPRNALEESRLANSK